MAKPSNPRIDRVDRLAAVVDGLTLPDASVRITRHSDSGGNLADVVRDGFRRQTEGRVVGLRFEAFDAIIQTIGTLRALVEQQSASVDATRPLTLITTSGGNGALYDRDGSLIASDANYVIAYRAIDESGIRRCPVQRRSLNADIVDFPTNLNEVGA